ncbi:MAG TPA: hypothetical protein VND64_23595, partial [Pirellulales bacterium]|nr:hypothetical protein [Pirellulales bacterium]
MDQFLSIGAWVLLGAVVGAAAVAARTRPRRRNSDWRTSTDISGLIQSHFYPTPSGSITIHQRQFPFRVRADLQRAIDGLFSENTTICHFCGVRQEYSHEGTTLAGCLVGSEHNPAVSVPPEFEEIDVGDNEPVRCLTQGLWFLQQGESKYVVLLAPVGQYGQVTGIQFQIATANTSGGTRITQEFFKHLEDSVLKAESYRGKILSLERAEHSYSGRSSGIKVHKLRTVERDQVILPRKTLDLLERNVIQFVRQRPELAKFRQATKKGILFYGPPGTGKTHTLHYLAKALAGHTTLLIT